MSTTSTTRPVIVGYDDSATGTTAFAWAVREAERLDAPLHLVVAEQLSYAVLPGVAVATAMVGEVTERIVGAARDFAAAHGRGREVTVVPATGSPAAALVRASEDAVVVVLGRGRHGILGEAVTGSTSAQVVAHADCPVVVVEDECDCPDDAPVVVAVDGSSSNKAPLAYAFDRASELGAPVVAVHAWWLDVPDASGASWLGEERIAEIGAGHARMLEGAVAEWAEKYPEVEVRTAVHRRHPVGAILAEAGGAQLIVVGTRGHGGFAGLLLGSVSQGLLHHERPCPLAVIHPHE